MVYDFEALEAIEDKDAYTVTVKATDVHQISATVAVTIRLKDKFEAPNAPSRPTVSGHSIKSLSVSWRPPANNTGRPPIDSYNLQYLACMDGQCEPNPQDTDWSNGPQGVTDTSAVILGLDENTRYQVRVQATNEEGSGDWSQPGAGRTLAAPEFADATATRSVAENTPPGRNVGAVILATDADNDALIYTLEGADAASFDIVETSGQIRTKPGIPYNFEAKSSYTVTVRASDPSGASDTIAVTIEITDVLEPPLAPATPSVSSDSTTSLSVVWTAPDNTGRPLITSYDLQYRQGTSGSWTDGPQDLAATSRSATIPDPEDPELNENTPYQVQVRATNADGDGPWSPPGPGRTLAQDNAAPSFGAGTATRSIPENTGAGVDVGTAFTATDANNDPLTYVLEGEDAASFDLVTGTSAQIRTKPGVDL